jgi:CBS domain-containing protein
MDVSFKSISQNANLSDVLKLINVKRKNFFPVLDEGKLVGAIDLTNLSEFILIQSQLMKNEKSWNQ